MFQNFKPPSLSLLLSHLFHGEIEASLSLLQTCLRRYLSAAIPSFLLGEECPLLWKVVPLMTKIPSREMCPQPL